MTVIKWRWGLSCGEKGFQLCLLCFDSRVFLLVKSQESLKGKDSDIGDQKNLSRKLHLHLCQRVMVPNWQNCVYFYLFLNQCIWNALSTPVAERVQLPSSGLQLIALTPLSVAWNRNYTSLFPLIISHLIQGTLFLLFINNQ